MWKESQVSGKNSVPIGIEGRNRWFWEMGFLLLSFLRTLIYGPNLGKRRATTITLEKRFWSLLLAGRVGRRVPGIVLFEVKARNSSDEGTRALNQN